MGYNYYSSNNGCVQRYEQQCNTVNERQCSTVNEQQCSTTTQQVHLYTEMYTLIMVIMKTLNEFIFYGTAVIKQVITDTAVTEN